MILQLKRIFKFEFWPTWLFYLPVALYGLLLSLKARSITFFTAVNPGMKYSGGLEYSKMDYLRFLPKETVPKTILINKNIENHKLQNLIIEQQFQFPLIVKPDKGQRGKEVKKVDSFNELIDFLIRASRDEFLLQEYIDYPLELGIFFVKTPDGKEEKITSITKKKFLCAVGDGKSTLKKIVSRNIRAIDQRSKLKKELKSQWNCVVPKGEEILLEPIGNHNRGTEFINANNLISKELEHVISWVASHIPDFYYGRIDLKTKSIDALLNKDLIVLEVNGVNSEPSHIYDTKTKIKNAYRDIFWHMNIMFKISKQNKELKGVKTASFKEILVALYQLYSH